MNTRTVKIQGHIIIVPYIENEFGMRDFAGDISIDGRVSQFVREGYDLAYSDGKRAMAGHLVCLSRPVLRIETDARELLGY